MWFAAVSFAVQPNGLQPVRDAAVIRHAADPVNAGRREDGDDARPTHLQPAQNVIVLDPAFVSRNSKLPTTFAAGTLETVNVVLAVIVFVNTDPADISMLSAGMAILASRRLSSVAPSLTQCVGSSLGRCAAAAHAGDAAVRVVGVLAWYTQDGGVLGGLPAT